MIEIILLVWVIAIFLPLFLSIEHEIYWPWFIWGLLSFIWIIPILTGVHIKNNEGVYKGYITSIEQNGEIFKGWNIYLKTDLSSSNEDKACIDRNNPELIESLKLAQEKKENVNLEFEGVWEYAIGECPGSNWMVKKIKK